jgi:thioredoxin 1
MAASDSSRPRDEPIHVQGEDEFQRIVGNNPIILVDFHADWCGPCKMLEPIVESIAAETDATVAKVDVDANQQLAAAHGVRGVPTLELYHDGEQVEQIVGVQSEDQLRDLIQRYET